MSTREDILSLAVDAMEDAASGMRYVRENYGDLSGVGFGRVQEKYLNVISKLRAAPTPPAAEAPGQEPVYRFLKAGEIIQKGDENPDDDTHHWVPVMPQAIGWPRLAAHKTMRRLVSAPPTYADAEAKGFERGIEAAAKWHDAEFEKLPEGSVWMRLSPHMEYAAAIRSLASPAPKGET